MKKRIRSNRELGETIRHVRKNQGLRQIDLAQKASVRQPPISDIENGVTTARYDTMLKILAALDMDLIIAPRCKTEFDPKDY